MTIDLEQSGYRRVSSTRLWMRGDDSVMDFAYNDGDEFENWVAQTIQGATDVSTLSREIEHGIRDWPSRYLGRTAESVPARHAPLGRRPLAIVGLSVTASFPSGRTRFGREVILARSS
jgi:hypothetical protein